MTSTGLCASCGSYKVLDDGICRDCYQNARKRTKRPRKSINRVSPKRREQNKIYSLKRDAFLAKYNKCQMCYKNEQTKGVKESTEVHHKYRRIGKAFLDESTWIASCRACNSRIEENPTWAISNGFIATQEELTAYYKKHGK